MLLTITPLDERGVIRLEGELDMSSELEFDTALAEAITQGRGLKLDLSGLSFMGSCGLRSILDAAASLNGNGPLIVLNPSPAFRRIFDLVFPGGTPGLEILG